MTDDIYKRAELRREVDAFLETHAMKPHDFGRLARNDTAFVARLRGCGRIGAQAAAEARLFMERYAIDPTTADGCHLPPLPPSSSEKMAERVARDRAAIESDRAAMRVAAAPIVMRPLPVTDPVEALLLAAGPETPADAIRMIRERWPSTWRSIVAAARAERIAPGAMMMALLEEGLARKDAV